MDLRRKDEWEIFFQIRLSVNLVARWVHGSGSGGGVGSGVVAVAAVTCEDVNMNMVAQW
jgi:hypothetical protein